ncbi:MAG: FAD-dependent oxidoreductase [Alphaproteobacteria bacterium]
MSDKLPSEARVVVIGGGIVGCSVAYHLAELGWKDTLLLERRTFGCGTTWHAVGLVGQLRATQNLTRLAMYAKELFARLEEETGQTTGFRQTGSLAVAQTEGRRIELERGAAMARCFGVEMERIGTDEAKRLWPLMNTDDLEASFFIPGDGQTNPTDTTVAMAKGARRRGATVLEHVKVTGIHQKGGRVAGVATEQGDVACEYVVNCAGMWAREIGRMAGVAVPLHAAEHFYLITEPIEGVYHGMPSMRDPDGFIYFREEVGGLILGGFEPVAKPWGMDGIPEDFEFSMLNEDWDHFEVFMENALRRVPALAEAQIKQMVNGPESFTPDNRYILGAAPELKNFFVAAGFNSVGIASSAGAGQAVAQWVSEGVPPMDLWDVDIRRFSPWEANPRYLHDRTVETLGLLYGMHWPFRQPETARNLRCSVLHGRLAARGACFGVVAGWERVNWYAPKGVEAKYEYSFTRQNWFEHSAAEHHAAREAVALFDQSSFARFALEGRDAEAVLQRIASNDVAVPPGKIVYTQMLNPRGGIECDLTVTRIADDRYLIVTSAATARHDFCWIRDHIPDDAHAVLTDLGAGAAVLGVMGPNSRALLSELTDADLSNAAFPFGTAQEIDLAYGRVRALRITFVGELGWELYIPAEFAANVYDAVVAVGERFDLRHAGYHALDSLRCEKAYRHWGHDITSEDTPLEGGLGFAVKLKKNTDFIGRDALLAQKQRGLTRRLVAFTLDDPEPILLHDEPIYRDGELKGQITSGAYGHTLGSSVGLGYVENAAGIDDDYILSGNYEVDIAGKRAAATPHWGAPYDPKSKRPRM